MPTKYEELANKYAKMTDEQLDAEFEEPDNVSFSSGPSLDQLKELYAGLEKGNSAIGSQGVFAKTNRQAENRPGKENTPNQQPSAIAVNG